MKGVWNIKNRLFPKKRTAFPCAKKNISGQIITNHKELKDVYLQHFSHRMRRRPILPELKLFESNIEKEFSNILRKTNNEKSIDWKMKDPD